MSGKADSNTSDMRGVAPAPSQAGFGALAETSPAEYDRKISSGAMGTQGLMRRFEPTHQTAAARAPQSQPARAQVLPRTHLFGLPSLSNT